MRDPATASSRTRSRAVLGVAVLIVVIAAVVGLDAISRQRAVATISADLEQELGVPVAVQLSGPGTGLAAWLGRIATLEVSAQEVPLRDVQPAGLHISQLDVTLSDLRIDDAVPTSGTGVFTAAFDTEQVQLAAGPGIGQAIRLAEGAVVVDVGVAQVPLGVRIDQGSLRFVPPDELGIIDTLIGDNLTVSLDAPDGVVVDDAVVVDDFLVISGRVDPEVLAAAAGD